MRIGIYDPDSSELALVLQSLEKSGFDCVACERPAALRDAHAAAPFDALVIDCRAPRAGDPPPDALVRELADGTATLAMIAGTDERTIVDALSAGADDYLIKPIRTSELIARVQALLRRAYPHETQERFDFPPFRFQPDACEVAIDAGANGGGRRDAGGGHTVALTQKEFDLGLVLFRNAGRPLSRGHIRELVWGGSADVSSRTMDTHVSRLRTKLGLGPERGYRVLPVYGYGYRLDAIDRGA